MTGLAPLLANFFTEPTYDLPLFVATGLLIGLLFWTFRHVAPATRASATQRWGVIRLETRAYEGLTRGEFLPAIDLLGQRLARALRSRHGIRIDRRREVHERGRDIPLPAPLTVPDVVEGLVRAYRSAYLAELGTPMVVRWSWWERRLRRRAARDFTRAVAALEVAFPVLEGP